MSDTSKRKKKAKPLGHLHRKVINLGPGRIKESRNHKLQRELLEFLRPLSETELTLVKKVVHIIVKKPDEQSEPGKVIQFTKGAAK